MKKLKKQSGFTLVEMLACTITLVLIAGICATGMQVAVRSYYASIFESNSQMLESTLDLYLKDILRYASNVEVGEVDAESQTCEVLGLSNPSYQMVGGMISVGTSGESEGRMVVYDRAEGVEGRNEVLLIGKNVYADTLYIDSLSVRYNVNTKCFEGTYTIKCTMLPEVERACVFACRSVVAEINIP